MTVNRSAVQSYFNSTVQSASKTQKNKNSVGGFTFGDEFAKSEVQAAQAIQKEVSPLELYEQMRGSADVTRSHKVVSGVKWTDETLAVFARNGGTEIDTSKAVNWNATGEHTLSETELTELREKYDLENLTGQNFYDLMADLSDLNAISAEDIHGMFLKQAPPMGLYPSGTSSSGSSFGAGNIVNALKNELDSMSQMKDFLLSDDFWLMNASTNKDDHRNYMGYLDFRTNSMNKLQNIFSSIRA